MKWPIRYAPNTHAASTAHAAEARLAALEVAQELHFAVIPFGMVKQKDGSLQLSPSLHVARHMALRAAGRRVCRIHPSAARLALPGTAATDRAFLRTVQQMMRLVEATGALGVVPVIVEHPAEWGTGITHSTALFVLSGRRFEYFEPHGNGSAFAALACTSLQRVATATGYTRQQRHRGYGHSIQTRFPYGLCSYFTAFAMYVAACNGTPQFDAVMAALHDGSVLRTLEAPLCVFIEDVMWKALPRLRPGASVYLQTGYDEGDVHHVDCGVLLRTHRTNCVVACAVGDCAGGAVSYNDVERSTPFWTLAAKDFQTHSSKRSAYRHVYGVPLGDRGFHRYAAFIVNE